MNQARQVVVVVDSVLLQMHHSHHQPIRITMISRAARQGQNPESSWSRPVVTVATTARQQREERCRQHQPRQQLPFRRRGCLSLPRPRHGPGCSQRHHPRHSSSCSLQQLQRHPHRPHNGGVVVHQPSRTHCSHHHQLMKMGSGTMIHRLGRTQHCKPQVAAATLHLLLALLRVQLLSLVCQSTLPASHLLHHPPLEEEEEGSTDTAHAQSVSGGRPLVVATQTQVAASGLGLNPPNSSTNLSGTTSRRSSSIPRCCRATTTLQAAAAEGCGDTRHTPSGPFNADQVLVSGFLRTTLLVVGARVVLVGMLLSNHPMWVLTMTGGRCIRLPLLLVVTLGTEEEKE